MIPVVYVIVLVICSPTGHSFDSHVNDALVITMYFFFFQMRYESKPLSWLFCATSWMQPAYIIYKICDVSMAIFSMLKVLLFIGSCPHRIFDQDSPTSTSMHLCHGHGMTKYDSTIN